MASASYRSPLGFIEIHATETELTSALFVESTLETNSPAGVLNLAITQLQEYFAGTRKTFSLPLAPVGTDFQKQVWNELRSIPCAETRSYLDIALRLGDRNLTRAVGAANGKNPLAIIVPCHRVIGENGKLTGYAGGLWRKEWLLGFESGSEQGELFTRGSSVISK